MTPFCQRHAISFLNSMEGSVEPFDLALSRYFRIHKSLGASDRKQIGNLVYGMIRWKGLIDWLCPKSPIPQKVSCFQNLDWDKIKTRGDIPLAFRLGVSMFLYEKMVDQFGEEETKKMCSILNEPAPITIRVNLMKTTRDALFKKWEEKFSMTLCKKEKNAIHFVKREPLFSLPEFKEGLFEMQDLGSQMVANLVQVKPGDLFLDFCSGSGGKSLAIAPSMQGKGQIFLHDIRLQALREAKKRLKRAGIQNVQLLPPLHPQLKHLVGKCDWILIDVPCSGTGTFRRNPDQKWKIDGPSLQRLVATQRQIAKEAVQYLKPQGRLVYATCSFLREENEQQVDWIKENLFLQLEDQPLRLLAQSGGHDGFFAALFCNQKKSTS